MKTIKKLFVIAALVLPSVAVASVSTTAAAQDTGTPNFRVYDRVRGELSPDAVAPRRDDMVAAIDSATPSHLAAILEYGERVECHECVPLLTQRMLDPQADPVVREMAAWWLRRRPFGFGRVMFETRQVLASDADPARRAVAAQAIGEFMDWHGVEHLGAALMNDADANVRMSAVLGLARINAASALPFISQAFADPDAHVVDAALRSVLRVNFFRDHEGLLPLLAHEDATVRRRAALVIGTIEIDAAVPALAAMLVGDTNVMTRQAAAWALGRIGTADANTALREAQVDETSSRVLDAIEVALRM